MSTLCCTARADPDVVASFVRHMGARRFAYNRCRQAVGDALEARKGHPAVEVHWTGFDLINGFNAWKNSEAAGRRFAVDRAGVAELV